MKLLLDEAAVVLAEVLAVVLVLWYVYQKWVKPTADLIPSADKLAADTGYIAGALPGFLSDKLSANDGSAYMTDAQMRADAAARLAAKRAGGA